MVIIKVNGKIDSKGNDYFTPRCLLATKLFRDLGKFKVNLDELYFIQSINKVNSSIYWS